MPNPSTVTAAEVEEGAVSSADFDVDKAQEAIEVVVRESKAGYKTTEFWVTVIASLAVVFNGVPAPESKEGYIAAALAGLYAVSRGLAKRGIPHVEPQVPHEAA